MAEGQKHTGGLVSLHRVSKTSVVAGERLVASCGGYSSNAAGEDAHGENEANARRIAACWNACVGIPTEELEAGLPNTRAESGLVKELAAVLKQVRLALGVGKALTRKYLDMVEGKLDGTGIAELREVHYHARDAIDTLDAALAKAQTAPTEPQGGLVAVPFQSRVKPWMDDCFGPAISGDKVERNHRFLEEALELVQACGCSREDCLQLVDYVYGRPTGEPRQEVGGVMVTLAALCLANALDMHEAAEVELARVWAKIDMIRAKQAAKPRGSALPTSPSYENPTAKGAA